MNTLNNIIHKACKIVRENAGASYNKQNTAWNNSSQERGLHEKTNRYEEYVLMKWCHEIENMNV